MKFPAVETWNPERGFGFVEVDGKRCFVHFSALSPRPKRGEDLTGLHLTKVKVEKGPKGWRVASAKLIRNLDEYRRNRAEAEAKKAEAEAEKERARARKAQLRAQVPALQERVNQITPLTYGQVVDLGDGWTAHHRYDQSVEVVAVDPEGGPTLRFRQEISLKKDDSFIASFFGEGSRSGWEGVRLESPSSLHKLDAEKGALLVRFSVSTAEFKAAYPATAGEPYINSEESILEQVVSAETPLGKAETILRIYQNPDRGFGRQLAWGFDDVVIKLQAKLDALAQVKLRLGEMPTVEFSVCDWAETYQVGGKWESDDGYMAGNDSHKASISRGGVRVVVWSPFLDTVTDTFSRNTGKESVGTEILVQGMPSRREIAGAVKKRLDRAVAHWNLADEAGEKYARQLFRHIMSHIPDFQVMRDIVLVDEDHPRIGQIMRDVPHGLTVVEFEEPRLDSYLRSMTPTRVMRVVTPAVAEKYSVPGTLSGEDTVVYWPAGQVENTSPKEIAARLKKLLGAGFAGTESEESWFQLATEDIKGQAQRLLDEYQRGLKPHERAFWVERAQTYSETVDKLEPTLREWERLQKEGGILVDFGGRYRRAGVSGNCNYWVILPDGSFRNPDSQDSDSKSWRLVEKEELALQWSCGSTRDIAGSSHFEVAKLPVGGCTEAQLVAVGQVEQELGVPADAFGLNPTARREHKALVHTLEEVCRSSGFFKRTPELDFLKVTGPYGQEISEESGNLLGSLAHWDGRGIRQDSFANRNAQLLKEVPVADGKVQFWLYHKFGCWNLGIRYTG